MARSDRLLRSPLCAPNSAYSAHSRRSRTGLLPSSAAPALAPCSPSCCSTPVRWSRPRGSSTRCGRKTHPTLPQTSSRDTSHSSARSSAGTRSRPASPGTCRETDWVARRLWGPWAPRHTPLAVSRGLDVRPAPGLRAAVNERWGEAARSRVAASGARHSPPAGARCTQPVTTLRSCIELPRGSPSATVAAHEIGTTQVGDAEDEGDEAVAFVVVAMSRMRTQLMAR